MVMVMHDLVDIVRAAQPEAWHVSIERFLCIVLVGGVRASCVRRPAHPIQSHHFLRLLAEEPSVHDVVHPREGIERKVGEGSVRRGASASQGPASVEELQLG